MATKTATRRRNYVTNVLMIHENIPCWLHYLIKLEYMVKIYYKIITVFYDRYDFCSLNISI